MPDDMMHGVMELIIGEQQDDKKVMLRALGTGRKILCLTCATALMQWMSDGKQHFTLHIPNFETSTSPAISAQTSFNGWNNACRQSSSYFELGGYQ